MLTKKNTDTTVTLQRLILALEGVETLIEHQYTGTREAMSALQNVADEAHAALAAWRAVANGMEPAAWKHDDSGWCTGHRSVAQIHIDQGIKLTPLYAIGGARFRTDTPERIAFAKHMQLVAKALHDIEWVDSDDYGPGEDSEAIRACITSDAVLAAAIDDAQRVLESLRNEIELARLQLAGGGGGKHD